MAIYLDELFQETGEKYELQLIAGKDGLHREVNWVYVAEDQTNASFLRTGELIISTGALYDHSQKWLLRFIRTLHDHHTCGLILNLGKHLFLPDITDTVKEYCDQHDFPLFTMPWHIHIYDITRDYYDRIFIDARTKDSFGFYKLPAFLEHENALKNAEMMIEDDYNMIDGIVNNGPKEERAAKFSAPRLLNDHDKPASSHIRSRSISRNDPER